MTAASELKSAAAVVRKELEEREGRVESRKRKTPGQKKFERKEYVKSKTAVTVQAVQASQEDLVNAVKEVAQAIDETAGSMTASATKTVASASAEHATSGSTAARLSGAASMQATRLPVSVFFQNSRIFPTIHQNPVAPRHSMPGLFAYPAGAAGQRAVVAGAGASY